MDFDAAMLSWEPGLRPTDGVWAPHWYDSVVRTTSFGPYRPKEEQPPAGLEDVRKQCDEYYQLLYDHRLH